LEDSQYYNALFGAHQAALPALAFPPTPRVPSLTPPAGSGEVTLQKLLKAYEVVLPRHGARPEEDIYYYRLGLG